MKIYKLKKDFDSAWVNYHFYKLEDPKYYEKRIIGLNKYTDDEPIFLEVRNIAEDNTDEGWAFKDYFEWKSGSPNAVCMVISDRLKTLLYEQLVLPKHYLYPTEIWNPRTNETRTDYYVMHIVNNIFEEIDINESEFGNFHIREKRIQSKIEKGLLKSISDIEKLNEELFITSHGKVEPLLMKFKDDSNLDIFCLEPNRVFVYITSKAKEILTANNISGIDFIELSFDDAN